MWRRRALLSALTVVLLTLAVLPTNSAFTGSTSNPTSNFSAATSFCASYTPAWMTGLEHGVIYASSGSNMFETKSTTGGSAATADTAITRSGNYSLKLVKANGGDGYLRAPALGVQNVVVARLAVRFQTLPSSSPPFFLIQATAGAAATLTYNSSTQKLDASIGGSTVSSAVISAARWYLIDVRATFNTNPRTMEWRIDGVGQTTATGSVAASTHNGVVQFGEFSNTNAYTVYFDDLALTTNASTYSLPDGRIESLVPDAVTAVTDGSGYLDFDTGSAVTNGGTLWNRLDETPMTVTTDFMKQIGNDSNAYAQLSFGNVASTGCVAAVSGVLAYHSSNATGATGKTAIWESGTERVIHNSTMNPGATITHKAAATAPASGTWDASKLTAATARIGYSPTATAANYAAWDALRLEYEQIPDLATDYANTVLADSPAGYWRFGELSGTTATAASGTPNGTYTNGPVLGMGGAVHDGDSAVKFDGSNDYVTFGDVYDLTGTSNFSLEAWVKPAAAATANFPMIMSKYGSSGWNLYMENNAQPNADAVTFERLASGSDYASTATSLQPGTWYHVVATYDGSRMRVYLNGALGDNIASSRSLTNTATAMTVGGTGDPFNGQIDEVAIYTTALNQTRIQAHYDAGKP